MTVQVAAVIFAIISKLKSISIHVDKVFRIISKQITLLIHID